MISRAGWRDILQRIKKGGVDELKTYSENVAKQALRDGYEQGLLAGAEESREKLMSVIGKVLHKEFGIGKKRLDQFQDSLLKEVNNQVKEVKEEKQNTVQQLMISRNDEQRYMILTCIAEYLSESLKVSGSDIFGDVKTKHCLSSARDNMEIILDSVKEKLVPQDYNRMMKELEEMTLYLAPLKNDKKSVS